MKIDQYFNHHNSLKYILTTKNYLKYISQVRYFFPFLKYTVQNNITPKLQTGLAIHYAGVKVMTYKALLVVQHLHLFTNLCF